jgi:hypothetical protein
VDVWPQIVFGGVVAGIIAQVISGRISRSVKVSEFRQKWIDALREDVAVYIGATHNGSENTKKSTTSSRWRKEARKIAMNCCRFKMKL